MANANINVKFDDDRIRALIIEVLDNIDVLTDADRAVLDAAEAFERWHEETRARNTPAANPCACVICPAVRARREAQQ